jgi:hypothetical protein
MKRILLIVMAFVPGALGLVAVAQTGILCP